MHQRFLTPKPWGRTQDPGSTIYGTRTLSILKTPCIALVFSDSSIRQLCLPLPHAQKVSRNLWVPLVSHNPLDFHNTRVPFTICVIRYIDQTALPLGKQMRKSSAKLNPRYRRTRSYGANRYYVMQSNAPTYTSQRDTFQTNINVPLYFSTASYLIPQPETDLTQPPNATDNATS